MKGVCLQKLILFAIVLIFLLLQVPPPAASQGEEGRAISESDLEMIGLTEYSGGGHMTVQLTGNKASELRDRILWMFDERTKIPEGFMGGRRYTGLPTEGNNNGVLDEEEVLSYSKWVQYFQWERGVPYLFGEMTRAEMLEGESVALVELSTSGLVSTSVGSNEPVEMKHLFNARSHAQRRTYLLSDNLTVEALFRVFSLHLYSDFEGDLGEGDPWPFSQVGEPGTRAWVVTDSSNFGLSNFSLWFGNISSGEYDRGMVATTYADFDLRFAVDAAMRLNYMGGIAPEDYLRIQIREEGGEYSTLQTLTSADNTATFRTLMFDLDDYVGKKVRVNFNFTSTPGGTKDVGFFIDDFDISAPCTYVGTTELHHTDYLVGALSFPEFYPDKGTIHLIRTPAGMILSYSSSFESTDPSEDRALFTTFDFLDNPQILFVLMFICAYLISHYQNKYYNNYRRLYASMHRDGWYKRKWLHGIGISVIALFIIFYFFPSLFVLVGANFYLMGLLMWILYIVVCVVIVVGSKVVYLKAEEAIPPPVPREEEISVTVEAPPPEYETPPPAEMALAVPCSVCLEDLLDVASEGIKCRCGQVFHKECAAKAERCPNCNRLLEVVKPKEKRMVTVKCPSCSAIVLVEGDADLLKTTCESCGSLLHEVALGYNYLVVDDSPSVAYAEFKIALKKDVPGLCISTTFPDKLKKEFDIEPMDLYWLSDTATDMAVKTLDPRRLDFEMMRTISNFFKEAPNGVVMIDGVEYLVVENGFERVLRFVKKINDLASVNDATVFVPLAPSSLGSDEFAMLRKEFDKVQILSAAPLAQ